MFNHAGLKAWSIKIGRRSGPSFAKSWSSTFRRQPMAHFRISRRPYIEGKERSLSLSRRMDWRSGKIVVVAGNGLKEAAHEMLLDNKFDSGARVVPH